MARNKIIIILGAILLAVVVASVALLVFVPAETSEVSTMPTDSSDTKTTETETDGFNLKVFNSQAYQLLNQQLVKDGTLPVEPPPETGKANPFQ